MDPDGCIRMRGRIENSDVEYDQKHPYLLPGKAVLAARLMEEAHYRTEHGGVQVCMQYLRERYWIIGMRTQMKKVIYQCVQCTRYRRKAGNQLMGDLPSDRVQLMRPFTHSGVYYAGPFKIKARSGRNAFIEVLAYVALFVCCSTRLFHLELVSDATTQAFLAA